MQPEPHTHSRTHIAIDLKSTSERLQNHFYACLLFVGRILIPTSILYAAIGRVLTNYLLGLLGLLFVRRLALLL